MRLESAAQRCAQLERGAATLNSTCFSRSSAHSLRVPLAQPRFQAEAVAVWMGAQSMSSSSMPASSLPSQNTISDVISSRACSPPTSRIT